MFISLYTQQIEVIYDMFERERNNLLMIRKVVNTIVLDVLCVMVQYFLAHYTYNYVDYNSSMFTFLRVSYIPKMYHPYFVIFKTALYLINVQYCSFIIFISDGSL